jgi:hypothetical protein
MENTCSGYAATMHDPGSSECQAVTAEKDNSAQLCGYLCVPLRLNKTSLAEGASPPERNFEECSLKRAGKTRGVGWWGDGGYDTNNKQGGSAALLSILLLFGFWWIVPRRTTRIARLCARSW